MSNSVYKNSLILIFTSIIVKAFGFLREIVLSTLYGTNYISDAFILSFSLPDMFINALGAAVLTSFIPFYAKLENENDDSHTIFSGRIITAVTIISVIIYIVFLFNVRTILSIIAPGFDEKTLDLAVNFSKIMMFSVLFVLINSISNAFLEYKGKFFQANIVKIIFNIFTVTGLYLSSIANINYASYGYVIGYFLMTAYMVFNSKKSGFKFTFKNPFVKDGYMMSFLHTIFPVFLSQGTLYFSSMIDKMIASNFSNGSISALNYSMIIINFGKSIILLPIMSVLFPYFINNKIKNIDVNKSLTDGFNLLNVIMIPVAMILLFYSKPVVSILFERGSFDESSVQITSECLSSYSIILISSGMSGLLHKWYYSENNTRTPLIQSFLSVSFNIILTLILSKYFAHIGIALATTLGSIIATIIYFWIFSRKHDRKIIISILVKGFKILIFSLLAIFISKLVWNFIKIPIDILFINNIINLSIALFAGGIIYIFLIVLFDANLKKIIKKIIKEKFVKCK